MGLFDKNSKSKSDLQNEIYRLQAELAVIKQNNSSEKSVDSEKESEEYKVKTDDLKKQFEIKKQEYEIQINELRKQYESLKKQVDLQTETLEYIEIGLYTPKYEFESIEKYKQELEEIRNQQKQMIKSQTYATWNRYCVIGGDLKKGQKLTDDFKKLLLRAFNTECDELIRKVNTSNHESYLKKMKASCDNISKLGKMMEINISEGYYNLKVKELELSLDFSQFKQAEKERIRELKAQEREEAKVQKEIEEARKKLQKEQAHYQNAMQKLLFQLQKEPDNQDLINKKLELEKNIEDVEKAISDVDYRQANQKAGYVYVISNIGAFGKDIYKIGMTRRLDPMERIIELGNASVPFPFDVHALIFTEDAPKLEAALHNTFSKRKLNFINQRREFFKVTLTEIKKAVNDNFDKTVEWIDTPLAEQYRQSVLMTANNKS